MEQVLLVDDEVMLLDSLEIILSMNGYEIVGKARDGVEALEVLKSVDPGIALVDLNMKGMGGIDLIGEMKKKYPKIKILVLTTFYDDQNITEAISNGADGYLLKDSGKDAILGAIRQIMGGTTVLDAKVMQRLMTLVNNSARSGAGGTNGTGGTNGAGGANGAFAGNRNGDGAENDAAPVEPLTEREKEIAGLMVEGFTNRQIADRLFISEGTVKNYISSIYDKTGIHDRVKLTIALRG